MLSQPLSDRAAACQDTRARITEAACAIVVRDGYANLTLDAVAREAQVSKGGLLYHYPSKRALLKGMVEERCGEFERQVERFLELERGPGRWLRAVIRAASNPKRSSQQERAALFAVLANDMELLDKVRVRRARFKDQMNEEQSDPVLTDIVMLAIDGLCFNELLTLDSPRGARREQVIERLLKLATPAQVRKRSRSNVDE